MSRKIVDHRKTANGVEIQCPLCLTWQPLPVGDREYEIDPATGRVWPMFVCLHRGQGGYCEFAGEIAIR